MSYFQDVVLPSVGLTAKSSYNIKEVSQILDCCRSTVYRMAQRGQIIITPNKRVYHAELVKFFHNGTPHVKQSDN
ncbi:MAG TPA: DNA-binding protein [Desulfobacterales bacterium]|nr:DNA-binding protein [Desulfobacterales bacterium]